MDNFSVLDKFARVQWAYSHRKATLEMLFDEKLINEEQLKRGLEKLKNVINRKLRIMRKKAGL